MRYQNVEQAVDTIIASTNGKIVLGLPLGMGKPNPLANAIYRRACADSSISLQILTALSLTRPRGKSEYERRFLEPFVERVYGDYEELEYLLAARSGKLPANVDVFEFFVQPASELTNHYTQQNYINCNYTHACRDMFSRGLNVVAQAIARREGDAGEEFSLSCNPEVLLDALPGIAQKRERGETILVVGQVHADLPFMVNSAQVPAATFDIIVDDPVYSSQLINTPNMPVGMTEHFIGLGASALVKDGGTLQIGIGALGDAVAGNLLLRQQNNAAYQALLDDSQIATKWSRLLAKTGSPGGFDIGLYGCSEMLTYGLFKLMEAGVIKREVQGPSGQSVCMHGGFFLGPNDLYQSMRELSPQQLAKIDMTHISFVNGLYGHEKLKREQRVHARFINTAFTVTLMGAAVSDQLEDGRIISGVGGQYNFVAQGHELEGARSIMLVRAVRSKGGQASSNIVWNYGHNTIPRHLRDIIVSEYGIADLRAKTDSEVIAAMLNICDSRFQGELMAQAKSAGKLPADYAIPSAYTNNTPERLQKIYHRYREQGLFPNFPLGSDFTYIEEMLLRALIWLKENVKASAVVSLVKASRVTEADEKHFAAHLERMAYDKPQGIKESLYRQLLLMALVATSK